MTILNGEASSRDPSNYEEYIGEHPKRDTNTKHYSGSVERRHRVEIDDLSADGPAQSNRRHSQTIGMGQRTFAGRSMARGSTPSGTAE